MNNDNNKEKWGLFDGSFYRFGQRSATLGNMRHGESPEHVEWDYEEVRDVTFYTDMCLDKVHTGDGVKVAWLLEPPSISDTHYRMAEKLWDRFDYILTFDLSWAQEIPNQKIRYYPLGGSWIPESDWGIKEKTRMISLFTTDKHRAEGHQLRRKLARMLPMLGVDVFGRGSSNTVDSKVDGLGSYRYSIIVESWRGYNYFSEKMIDCISQGTVPIYWGSPGINVHFHNSGIITFSNPDGLVDIIAHVCSEKDYEERRKTIEKNFNLAKEFACAEDWIYVKYGKLFRETAERQHTG